MGHQDSMLETVDRSTLTPLVRQVLASADAEVVDWQVQSIHGGLGVAFGTNIIYRFSGTAQTPTEMHPWSLVLKVFKEPDAPTAPADATVDTTHSGYWKREILTYQSDLFEHLPDGAAVPRCYAVVEKPGGAWLWIENIENPDWSLSRYPLAARHLGRFNGTYLTRHPLPTHPWLGRSIIRSRAEALVTFWDQFADWRDLPLARHAWPGDLGDRALHLWNERDRLLDALDRLPQVLRHGDADRRNLFTRTRPDGSEETIIIDWAMVGSGPVGEDLGPLIGSSIIWFKGVVPSDLPTLTAAAFEAYLAGLRDVGWDGDADLVRFGFAVATALRYGPIFGGVAVGHVSDAMRLLIERSYGHTYEEILDRYAEVQSFVYDQLDGVRAGRALI
jgi:hypothetical protein